jgi:hypothetical protein
MSSVPSAENPTAGRSTSLAQAHLGVSSLVVLAVAVAVAAFSAIVHEA